ncbi:NACHT domain-containing protein [Duganella sp. PWIR1]
MNFIGLDRRFVPWTKGTREDIEAIRLLGSKRGLLTWPDLLKLKRVVVLAEGGSGKSSEFREQNRILASEGKFSFYLTVKKLGHRGVEQSLTKAQLEKFKQWRASDQPAWLFIDSVDEAKSDGVRLVDALEHLAEAIDGAERRAHVVVSGRHADWEFRKDRESLIELLPVPPDQAEAAAIDPDDLVIQAIRRTPQEKPKVEEELLIALMSELDSGQVATYARESKIENVQSFLDGLSEAKLWSFARRPLDLDWLVRHWRAHGSFAKFAAMLELNISERLTEPDPDRAKSIRLDQAQGMAALERVGAALVLGKLRDIEIPDTGNRADPQPALRLLDALPDMSQSLQSNLINSAVFVPSGVGMVRLHNDNEGAVSGYLAARWLKRLLDKNCPWSVMDALLFATTYGERVVKPSLAQTAAWLSIWEPRAADQLAAINPMSLVELGDAASLPLQTRKRVLNSVIGAFAKGDLRHLINHDGLSRFVQRDMESDVSELFERFGSSPEAKQVLLQMIDHGRLAGCSAIAFKVATDLQADMLSQSLAAQALSQSTDKASKDAYASFLRERGGELDTSVIWTALERLFPATITIDDLVAFLPRLLNEEPDGGTGIDFYGPRLAEKISTWAETSRLLASLFSTLPADIATLDHHAAEPLTERFSTVLALAHRVLDLESSPVPSDLVIDVSLRISAFDWRHGRRNNKDGDLPARLRETPARRRAALWRFSATHSLMGHSPNAPLNEPWQLHAAMFDHGLGPSDVDWLLQDAQSRQDENERLLAVRLALQVWSKGGQPVWLLEKTKEAAGGAPALQLAIETWVNPPPIPEQVVRTQERMRRQHEEALKIQKERDDSWVVFAQDIRSNPSQLDSLRPPDKDGVDARLYHIEQMLAGMSGNSQRWSVSDVELLTPLFGEAAIPHIRNAFIRYWRLGSPILQSERPVEEANISTAMERLGIAGLSIEATTVPHWISTLSDEQTEVAAIYATLELNSFPYWFEDLCAQRPGPAQNVLRRYVSADLLAATGSGYLQALERVARAPRAIAVLLAPAMLEFLKSPGSENTDVVTAAMGIAWAGLEDGYELLALSLERVKQAAKPEEICAYLACAFAIDGNEATSALFVLADMWDTQKKADVACILLPKIMGTLWSYDVAKTVIISTENLAKLIPFAYQTVDPKEDTDRTNGKVYSPGLRDHAQDARDRSISQLADRPGAATFKALNDLASIANFYVPRWRMLQLAHGRAELDSESAAWTPVDVKEFENDFDTVPRNPADLQRVAAHKIDDLQHKLVHGDYNQGVDLARLEHEVDVQRWVANALEARQGRSYTVVREPHVAAEKEPDIRLTAQGSGAYLPLEIKVAESWTVKELEEALTVQLQGRYLRDRDARWGILLLVHQNARSQGWLDTETGIFVSFRQVTARLQRMADAVAANDSAGPQMQVCTLDVSSVKR